MRLEARSPNCFSPVYVLKRDGRPIGEFRSRWFSESIDVRRIGRRGLTLAKVGWLGSQFQLIDAGEETVIGTARRAGLLTSAWDRVRPNSSRPAGSIPPTWCRGAVGSWRVSTVRGSARGDGTWRESWRKRR